MVFCVDYDAKTGGTEEMTSPLTIPRLVRGEGQSARRALVRPHEAAYLLQVPVREVRNQLRRRGRSPRLTPVRCGRRVLIAADELAERLRGNQLALELLGAVVDSRLVVPRPRLETEQPTSLIVSAGAI
jgi:hypothetical protein